MRKKSWIAALVFIGASVAVSAQKVDPDAQKLVDDYTAAFNKGDAKGVTALYAANGTRLGPDGILIAGRAAIDRGYEEALRERYLWHEFGDLHLIL